VKLNGSTHKVCSLAKKTHAEGTAYAIIDVQESELGQKHALVFEGVDGCGVMGSVWRFVEVVTRSS